MMMRTACFVTVLMLTAGVAHAGTVTGTITAQVGGAAIPNMEVRAWVQNSKGWSIHTQVLSNGSGVYSLTVPANDYKIDAREAPGGAGVYGDRWYDVAAPTSGGYIGENADVIAVPATGTVSGINLALEVLGGANGTATRPGAIAYPGVVARMERRADPRIHHNDVAKGSPQTGNFFFRGMPPASDYQIMIYDPTGQRDTLRASGPYNITSGNVLALGQMAMVDYGTDPYEGNNSPSCTGTAIDPSSLRMNPPVAWQSLNSRIGPNSANDVDWFCYQAVDGDRLLVSATTAFSFGGATRYDPWTDPLLSFWAGAGQTKLVEDDDSGPGGFDSLVDTGPLTAGCYCAAVTTFGDPDYNGTGQTSTGRYALRLEMGNRPAVLRIRKGTTEVPAAPAILQVNEDETLVLSLSYADADGDAVTPTFSHTDNASSAVTTGSLTLGASSGEYTWTPGMAEVSGSPYTLTLQGVEAEFTMSKSITIVVNAVNDPPTVPVPMSPIGGAVLAVTTPMLVFGNATDPEGDALSYDLEVYYDDPNSALAQNQTVSETAGGTTSWTTGAIAENTRVYWRVRANDGNGGLSQWSPFAEFLIDMANDSPEVPVLIKPTNGELLFVRQAGLAVINVQDPENDAVDFVFEVATDVDFTAVVWTSAPVPSNDAAATTMASSGDLAWGGSYFARVKAVDARGAESGWSNIRDFRLKDNMRPGTPGFDPGCEVLTYDFRPPSSIIVSNVDDPENEQVTFELEFFLFEDDPNNATPVLTASAAQSTTGSTTEIPFDVAQLENGHYRYRVRAFDGTDYSDWIECEFILALPGAEAGGCCQSSATGTDIAVALLILMLVATRRRYGPCRSMR